MIFKKRDPPPQFKYEMTKEYAEKDSKNDISLGNTVDLKTKIYLLGQLAESGDYQASCIFGEMLLKGVWDEERMAFDQLRGEYVPASDGTNSRDPYLILPRDPVRAARFIRVAADNQACAGIYEVERARSLLTYLQKHSLAGFSKDAGIAYPYADQISQEDKKYLKRYAKNAVSSDIETETGRFVPVRDVRPVIKDETVIFRNLAESFRNRCFVQCLVSFLLAGAFGGLIYAMNKEVGGLNGALQIIIFNCVAFIFPLLVFAFVAHVFGVNRRQPICNCSKINQAYETAITENACFVGKDPFRKTPFLVRNINRIKLGLFFSYILIASIVLIILVSKSNIIYDFLKYLNLSKLLAEPVPLLMLSSSLGIIVWEKNTSFAKDHCTSNDVFYVFLFSILLLVSEDLDCYIENEKSEAKKEIEKRITKIIQRSIE